MQFEQSFDSGLVDDVITMGISFKHDEQTPPVVILFILLVSFIIRVFVYFRLLERGLVTL